MTRIYPRGEDFLLLSPSQQANAYRNVDKLFATRTIRRGDTPKPLPRAGEISPPGLDDFILRTNVAGLAVLHNGTLVLERYALGLEETGRWSSMSMVKSMTSTLVGAALRDGAIASLDDPASRYVTALRGSAYDAVRVRDLLTMSSGVDWNEDYTDRNSHVNRYSKSLGDKIPGGVLALMKTLAPRHAPGTVFNYNTGDTYLLGCLVTAATGQPLALYMSEKIWVPCGMESDAFYTLDSEHGQEIGGSRAGMALRDFLRFGQFILDGGPILPDFWLDEANSRHFQLNPAENSWGANGYGYSWWIDPDGAMVAVGFAGQSLYINRARRLVIATLSAWPQPPYAAAYGIDFPAQRQAFKQAIIDALPN